MRTALITLAAIAIASPASAQYAPQHYGHPMPAPGYGNPGYGFGHVRALQLRVDRIQTQIRFLDRRNILSRREAGQLREQSQTVERRLHRAARSGLSPWEARDINERIARLEHRVHREAMDRNGRWGRYAHRDDDRGRDGRRDRHDD